MSSHILLLVLFVGLARDELGDDTAARASMVLLATYPFSVFHGAVYTESLYLVGVLGAVLGVKRQRWPCVLEWEGWTDVDYRVETLSRMREALLAAPSGAYLARPPAQ